MTRTKLIFFTYNVNVSIISDQFTTVLVGENIKKQNSHVKNQSWPIQLRHRTTANAQAHANTGTLTDQHDERSFAKYRFIPSLFCLSTYVYFCVYITYEREIYLKTNFIWFVKGLISLIDGNWDGRDSMRVKSFSSWLYLCNVAWYRCGIQTKSDSVITLLGSKLRIQFRIYYISLHVYRYYTTFSVMHICNVYAMNFGVW